MTLDHADLREALLAAEISREVSAHLERCPDCASLARDLQAIDALAPSLEAELALPPGLIEKTLARIADNRDARTPYVDHVDVREALVAGEINAAVSAHLEHCPDCASLALDLQAIDALAPSLEAELALPPGLIEKTLARIADNRDVLLPQFGTATVRALSPPRRRAPRGIERLNASRLNRWLLFGGIAAALLMFCIGIGAGMVPWNALRGVQKVQPGATITSSEAAARAHPPQLRVDVDALATALRHRADLFSSPIHLHGVDLGGADLGGANLQGADFSSANLQGADLTSANLQGANLINANLQGAHLSGAHLEGARLFAANLRGARLPGANLTGADLDSANLAGATLTGATLDSANLKGADLAAVVGMTRAQLESTVGTPAKGA